MSTAIKVENLSKIYRLGEIGTGTISRDLERWFKMRVLQQEDPFLKIGESNDRSKKGSSDLVYSLKDINFEIAQGDAVGIIGRNGAGKSTLLKILSRVTTPSTGKINIKGRVASLLEVGTGFHPELTGRENIYLNGAILGMRKKEIDRKLDEIIDFSGVERYIDTPVKRYSSGMYVRLAFAVAAHLESEILIVDEVLAVGDAEFQKKCLGKMGEVSKGEGRTVLFVSHNMAAVQSLCKLGLFINDGLVSSYGNISSVLNNFHLSFKTKNTNSMKRSGNKKVYLHSFNITNNNDEFISEISVFDSLKINIELYFEEDYRLVDIGINFKNQMEETLTHIANFYNNFKIQGKKGELKTIEIICNNINFVPGEYFIDIGVYHGDVNLDTIEKCLDFKILNSEKIKTLNLPTHIKTCIKTNWKYN